MITFDHLGYPKNKAEILTRLAFILNGTLWLMQTRPVLHVLWGDGGVLSWITSLESPNQQELLQTTRHKHHHPCL